MDSENLRHLYVLMGYWCAFLGPRILMTCSKLNSHTSTVLAICYFISYLNNLIQFKYGLKMFQLKFYHRCFGMLSMTVVFPHNELYCFL